MLKKEKKIDKRRPARMGELETLCNEFYVQSMYTPQTYKDFVEMKEEFMSDCKDMSEEEALKLFTKEFMKLNCSSAKNMPEDLLETYVRVICDSKRMWQNADRDVFEMLHLGGRDVLKMYVALYQKFLKAQTREDQFVILSETQDLINSARRNRISWSLATDEYFFGESDF